MKENVMLFEILNNVASSTAFPFQNLAEEAGMQPTCKLFAWE